MATQKFGNVWDALAEDAGEAQNLKLRSSLMRTLRDHYKAKGLNQADIAAELGVGQPRVSDLMRGKISAFSLDALVKLASAAGIELEFHVLEPA